MFELKELIKLLIVGCKRSALSADDIMMLCYITIKDCVLHDISRQTSPAKCLGASHYDFHVDGSGVRRFSLGHLICEC